MGFFDDLPTGVKADTGAADAPEPGPATGKTGVQVDVLTPEALTVETGVHGV